MREGVCSHLLYVFVCVSICVLYQKYWITVLHVGVPIDAEHHTVVSVCAVSLKAGLSPCDLLQKAKQPSACTLAVHLVRGVCLCV